MKYFLKHITELNWLAGILLSVAAIGMWIPDFLNPNDKLWQTTLCLMLTIGNAVMLMYIIYKAGITRTRTSLPVFCYILSVSAICTLHEQWECQLSVLALQMVLLLLLNSYRSTNAVHESFIATTAVCLAAILQPDAIVLLPVLWAGMGVQRAFSLRVALSSVVAICLFLLYGWILGMLWPDIFGTVGLKESMTRAPIDRHLLLEVCYTGVMGIVFIVLSLLGFTQENSRAQSLVIILIIIMFISGIMMFFPPRSFSSTLCLAVFAVCALAAYCFSSRQTVSIGIIFLLFIISSIAIFITYLLKNNILIV